MLVYRFKKGMEGAAGYAQAGGWDNADVLLKQIGVSPEDITHDFFNTSEDPEDVATPDQSKEVKMSMWTNCGRRWYNEMITGWMQPDGSLLVTEEEFEQRCC